MSALSALRLVSSDPELDLLVSVVRPEFAVARYRALPDDPVLARAPCRVDGCDQPSRSAGLCAAHHHRWVSHGQPDLDSFVATATPVKSRVNRVDEIFDLSALPPRVRLELGFVLQCRHDERGRGLSPMAVRPVVATLTEADAASLLERSVEEWIAALRVRGTTPRASAVGFLRYAYHHLEDLYGGGGVEAEYARDDWDAVHLGVTAPGRAGHGRVSFARIPQPWLRRAVKSWARRRLSAGMSFGGIRRDASAMIRFARWLADACPDAGDASVLTRARLEAYLAHLAAAGPVANTRLGYLTSLRGFLKTVRRRDLLDGLPPEATLYHDDLPKRPKGLPRFVPENQMAQLESEEALAKLPDPTTRHLVIVLIETGLRSGDACRLRVDCLVADSVGWPCLQFFNTKVVAERLIPLSGRAADAISAQQREVARISPSSPWLFPAPRANPDGARPFEYATLRGRLRRWQDEIGLHDQTGRLVRVSAHRWRHTHGTRLINQGVPEHVVQRLLGHASPMMTATYARLHDSTVREAFTPTASVGSTSTASISTPTPRPLTQSG
ncbi:MAG: tyrosine-type recombinase/integrase [Actinomycetota bacterium]|jgi:integrase|nr:tyrosine-type recombinase/integrase [Actinomycetota bacterium]